MKKVIFVIICLCIVFNGMNYVNAANNSWFDQATIWKIGGGTEIYLDESILSDLANLIEIAGTAVIAIATVVIGVRYVLGSVTEKASAKENLITLLVACIFFFGWSNIRDILITGATFTESGTVNSLNGNVQLVIFDESQGAAGLFKGVFGIVLVVAEIIAILASAYMGVKYIFSGGEGKAKIKEKSIGYIIGIIMIFTALNFIRFISSAINGAF